MENDIYGDAYKIVKNQTKQRNPRIDLTTEDKIKIAKDLFVVTPPNVNNFPALRINMSALDYEEIPLTSDEELILVSKRLKTKKAPGPDGITAVVFKSLLKGNGNVIRSILDKSFLTGTFPEIWKTTKLVLIEKPKKVQDAPTKYRPICLIDELGKALETIVNHRLLKEIEKQGNFHTNQYGFRKGRGTTDAARHVVKMIGRKDGKISVLVLLDIKNAFNKANWNIIKNRLTLWNMPPYLVRILSDYLNNRKLIIGNKKLNVYGGSHRVLLWGQPSGIYCMTHCLGKNCHRAASWSDMLTTLSS